MSKFFFSESEKIIATNLVRYLIKNLQEQLSSQDRKKLLKTLQEKVAKDEIQRDVFLINPILLGLNMIKIATEEFGIKREGIISIMLYSSGISDEEALVRVKNTFGGKVENIIRSLEKIKELSKKNSITQSEDFRDLLLSIADDVRVILIMIVKSVALMREIKDTPALEAKINLSLEASGIYAPLAHKLGLYKIKSELEDLSLKYLETEAYYMIKEKLSQTKKSRDLYMEKFILPIKEKLDGLGFSYHIKGRTKSIHSIWQKMKRQKCDFEGIYDLFAIRIILDAPKDQEKMQCWQVFALITNMYQPNPKRLRDWISLPKANGYESLHITVLGPENKWVEVQIRTSRMDEVAEHGFAAHWRYKGVKEGGSQDEWLIQMRALLESKDEGPIDDAEQIQKQNSEVFVFTPKGDLMKFSLGATVLDFAYRIHTKIGNHCTGAKINGKVVTFRYKLQNGDQIQIVTSANQKPKREWLDIVKTPRAKAKIRLAIKELEAKDSAWAKEMFIRRLRNHKISWSESTLYQLIKKLGFKEINEFYGQLASGSLDVSEVIDIYKETLLSEDNTSFQQVKSAKEFSYENPSEESSFSSNDVIVIDQNLKDVDFSLAKCCKPIYGDDVFGFVTVNGGIKIHRSDCPNAPELKKRFLYRIVKAKWSGKKGSKYSVTLKVIGNDDIGIINNITSVISKEEKIMVRSINIDSNDGLFHGVLTVDLEDTSRLKGLIKKLSQVKGVKQIIRL